MAVDDCITESPERSAAPFVYLFAAGDGVYKIGFSNDPHRRLNEVPPPPGSPGLTVAHVFQTDYAGQLERALHWLHADRNIATEWFRLTDADVDAIRALDDAKAKAILADFYARSNSRFGVHLSNHIAASKLPVTRVAKMLGMTRAGVYLLLNGTNSPTWETVQKVADTFGVSTDSLR